MHKSILFPILSILLLVAWSSAAAQVPPCDITWRKAANPHVISGTQSIAAGQHVCAEPGVAIQMASDGKLNVYGRLTAIGTTEERITVSGMNVFPNRVEVAGTVELQYADVTVPLNLNAGGTLSARNSAFGALGMITVLNGLTSWFSPGTRFLQLEDTVFDTIDKYYSSDVFVVNVTAVLRNVTFRNKAQLNIRDSYLYIDNVVSQNSSAAGIQLAQGEQPQFLENISVTGSNGAGIQLNGGNFHIGPNVTIQNAEYPIAGGGGLLPGSMVPLSGNRNNWIEAGSPATGSVYAPVGLPYVVSGQSIIGGVLFMPGVVVKARSSFGFTAGRPLRALGLPDAPVTIEPFDPAQKWAAGKMDAFGSKLEYVVLDGSSFGIAGEGGANTTYHIDNSVIRNHNKAITSPQFQYVFLSGNLFSNNGVAIDLINSGVRASGRTNPNLFENNTIAVRGWQGGDFRYNWWNSPSGPAAPNNPGGTGDAVTGSLNLFPFRTARPDRADHPPVVRMPRLHHNDRDSASKLILTWSAFDNAQIVRQKILFSPEGNDDNSFSVVADNLPPSQRAFELRIPSVGFQPSGGRAYVRVVAVDDKGQEGWDEWQMSVPSDEMTFDLEFTSQVAGQVYRGNHPVPLNWTITAGDASTSLTTYLILDADRRVISLVGGGTGPEAGPVMPNVSTDSARFLVVAGHSVNRFKWFVTPSFSIRPDSRYPDAPPQVVMSSPEAGQSFPAGGTVPIVWNATDDEAIRRFDIMASTDGGRSWSFIAEGLSPATTNFNWQLPPGSSIPDVRVRVIAVDRRYQNSSDGADRVFHIVRPPTAPPSVQITHPANNSSSGVGTSIFIAADASDSDGSVQRVDFYVSTTYAGAPSRTLLGSDTTAPYQVGWDIVFSGNYVLTAEAIDDSGMVTTSQAVNFTVPATGGPLPIEPPEITAPEGGTLFPSGSDIVISAYSGYSGLDRIEFYSGTERIGSDSNAPYSFTWRNVPAGRYTISAKAISGSAQSVSRHVDILVGEANAPRAVPFDFDGDGKTDISTFKPGPGEWWYLRSSDGGNRAFQFGAGTDVIVPADYTGDGRADSAFYRNGEWFILRSNDLSFYSFPFGNSTDTPVPADYDGDGKADAAVYRASSGQWFIQRSSDGQVTVTGFGNSTDRPVPADLDGDGKADLAVFRPLGESGMGEWWYLRSSDGTNRAFAFGQSTDKTVVGDYTGDGKADIAFFRPSTGVWFVLRSEDLSFYSFPFGTGTDIPAPGDYDGDGKTDPAVFRPSDTNWYVLRSTAGILIQQFGAPTDKPVPGTYVR